MTVLFDECLPEGFKKFATDISITSSSVQYINDVSTPPRKLGVIRPFPAASAACVSAKMLSFSAPVAIYRKFFIRSE